MTLGVDWAVDWLTETAGVLAEKRMELIELDRAIGDADHGENMDRGFQAVLEKFAETPPTTAGGALKTVAMTLMSKVGGAAGPLYGTAFLRAGTALGDAEVIDAPLLVAALTAARDGIVARGKAEVGDKTMIDAWTPAVDAAVAAEGSGVLAVLNAAADAAEAGSASTGPLQAHKGRASYLGERSIGHVDPGSRSTAYILRAAANAGARAESAGDAA